jgi:hypothetical protein
MGHAVMTSARLSVLPIQSLSSSLVVWSMSLLAAESEAAFRYRALHRAAGQGPSNPVK